MRGFMLLCLAIGLVACDTPPPGSYFKGQTAAQGTAIGTNKTGEPCILVERNGGGGDIFCGAWQQASARVRPGKAGDATNLMAGGPKNSGRARILIGKGHTVIYFPFPTLLSGLLL